MSNKSQNKTILKHMKTTGSITNREGIVEYNIMAMPRRIKDLKELGYNIESKTKKNPVTGQRYVRYYLLGEV